LESCYETDPVSQGGDVKGPKDAADPRTQQSWHPQDRIAGAPVVIREESRSHLIVKLGARDRS
jgi:hypothetical protein